MFASSSRDNTTRHDTTRTRHDTFVCSTCWRREPTRECRTGWAGRCATRQSNRSPPTRRPSRSCWTPCRKVPSRRHRPDTPPTHATHHGTPARTHAHLWVMLHRNGRGDDSAVQGVRGSRLAAVRQVQGRILLLTGVSAQVSRRLRAPIAHATSQLTRHSTHGHRDWPSHKAGCSRP